MVANVGNLGQDDYDWGETIFHTASKFVALPAWQQRAWKALRHPLPFFLIAPLLPGPRRLGRPRSTDLRAVVNAIQYIASTGCQWTQLPRDF